MRDNFAPGCVPRRWRPRNPLAHRRMRRAGTRRWGPWPTSSRTARRPLSSGSACEHPMDPQLGLYPQERVRGSASVPCLGYCSNMRSSSREEVVEVLDALEAGYKRALDLTFDVLTTPERLAVLARFEGFRRRQPAIEHPLLNQLAAQADAAE